MKTTTDLVVGALLDEDKILIGQRKDSDLWELPGGKIEENESPYDAIRREWKEELDIDVMVYYSIPERKMDDYTVYPHLLKYESGKPKLNDHKKVKFITLNEINKHDLTSVSKKTLYIIKGSYHIFLRSINNNE